MDISGTRGASDVKLSLIGSDMTQDPIRRGRGQSARETGGCSRGAESWQQVAAESGSKRLLGAGERQDASSSQIA